MKLYGKIFAAMLALTLASCKENDIVYNTDDLNLRPVEVSGPAITAHVPLLESIRKYMNFENLDVEDGLLCLKYTHTEELSWGGEEEEELGVISGITQTWGPLPFVGGIIEELPAQPIHLESSSGSGSYINRAEITSGDITFTFNATGTISGNVLITIPELTKNGIPFEGTIPLTSGNSFPLAGYIMETDNTHDLNVKLSVDNATGAGSLNVEFKLTDLYLSYLNGYFGLLNQSTEGAMEMDFFKELEFEGTVGIRNIRIDMETTNRVGMPMDASGKFYFVNDQGLHQELSLSNPFAFSIPAATESGAAHTVTPATTSFSTAVTQIEIGGNSGYPAQLKYEVTGTGNPVINPANNFIVNAEENLAEVTLNITVPLYLKASAYTRADTIEFDYNQMIKDDENGKFTESVQTVIVNLKIDNHLPFEVSLKAIAIDGQNNHVDDALLPDATIIASGLTEIQVTLTQEQIRKFRTESVKNIVLQTSAQTDKEDYVQVKSDAYIDISVSVKQFKSDIPFSLSDISSNPSE